MSKELWYISIADAICNCPIPSYLQPESNPTPLYPSDFEIIDSDLKIVGHIYPFAQTSDSGSPKYSTVVSYLNCGIT